MRFKVLSSLIGILLVFLALFMLLPLIWSLLTGQPDTSAFLISIGITLLVGLVLWKRQAISDGISLKESFAFVALGWLGAAAFGALPFLISGAIPSVVDAFFESMSGFSTTGATILTDIESLPEGILFWRSLTHWLGGMGIIVFFVAVMPRMGIGGMNLLRAEVPGPVPGKLVPRIAVTAKLLWMIYLAFTLIQILLLLLVNLSLFDAITHTFATLATGGFSPYNNSISGLESPSAELIIILFMFIAGGNFALYYALVRGQFRSVTKDPELRFYALGVVSAAVLVTATLLVTQGGPFFQVARTSVFQVVSIVTTTGFTTVDYNHWPYFARMVIVVLMFMGGSRGSTGGSIKQIRILTLIKYSFREIQKVIHPRAVIPVRVGDEIIPDRVLTSIVAFVFLYLLAFTGGTLIMTALGLDLISAGTSVAATLGNVGPGLSSVGPAENYAFIPSIGKVILSFFMMLGRLEIYTILVLLLPDFVERR